MKREENESFEEYRKRRTKAQQALKIYLRGHTRWDSKNLGTYRKKKQMK